MGRGLTALFVRYFRLPIADTGPDWGAIGGALTVVFAAAALGALQAVRSVTRLQPVEAMRPPSPPVYQRGLLERLRAVRRMPVALLMIARNLRLAPLRALASIAALAFATSLCVTGSFFGGALDALVHHQFDAAMREDLSVAFVRPLDSAACATPRRRRRRGQLRAAGDGAGARAPARRQPPGRAHHARRATGSCAASSTAAGASWRCRRRACW